MNRSVIAAAVLFIASGVAARLQAQMPDGTKTVSFGVSAGLTIPTEDFADEVDNGFNVGAHLGLRQPAWPVGLRLDGQLNRFDLKGVSDVYVNIIGVSLNAVLMSAGASEIKPYLIAGPSFFHEASYAEGATNEPSENNWGFNAGGGLQYQLSGFTTFLEARYNWMKSGDSHDAFVPISVGIMFR
jgi:opacity protein-like surface antigen